MSQKKKGSANNNSWTRSALKLQNINFSTVKDQFRVIKLEIHKFKDSNRMLM